MMVSVVIPTFNRGPLVSQAVDSVLRQEYPGDMEIIVVDDGSTDDTRTIVAAFGERVRYISQPNRGMNAARNVGIEASRGEYVALLDSDDVWLPFKLSLQLEVMERFVDPGFSFTNFYIWRNDGRIEDGLSTWMAPGKSLRDHAQNAQASFRGEAADDRSVEVLLCDIYELSLFQPVVLPSTSMIRSEVLQKLGPLPEDDWMCGDWEYFANASKNFGAAYISVETTLNRSHDDPVRLMRRDLTDRTWQRIKSIRRTWKADEQFSRLHSSAIAAVEAHQWKIICKRACYDGDFDTARLCLSEIESALGRRPLPLRLLYLFSRLPGARALIGLCRTR